MKQCKYCGRKNPDSAVQCEGCGSNEFQRCCANCGHVFEGVFCPKCGVKAGSRPKQCPVCGNEYYSNACPNCGYIPYANTGSYTATANTGSYNSVQENTGTYNAAPVKRRKRHGFWWVMGWIFIFPIPLTVLIARNRRLPKHWKAIIILIGWLLYIGMGAISSLGEDSDAAALTYTPPPAATAVAEAEETAAP